MASTLIVDQIQKTGGSTTALTLPTSNASANEFLQNDGAGALSWASAAAGGKLLQVIQSVKTDTDSTSSTGTSFVDIAGTDQAGSGSVWCVKITPSAAT